METDETSGVNGEDEDFVAVDMKDIAAGQSYALNGMDVSVGHVEYPILCPWCNS